MSVCGRYAPSPTGVLHLGNLRTALIAWLQAKITGNKVILRFDDLDQPRNKPGSVEQILNDLDWLGLTFDPVEERPIRKKNYIVQSERAAHYQQAFDQLLQHHQLFPCQCSRKDIAEALQVVGDNSNTAAYPGTCRPSSAAALETEMHDAAWRFMVNDNDQHYQDCVGGIQHYNLAKDPGDFVVRRKDGIFAYQLASVVDDALLGVTDVVRGDDLQSSTGRQIALFAALGYVPPRFWHVPLMRDDQGNKLSKRDGADSLAVFRQQGASPTQMIGLLAASLGLVSQRDQLSAIELAQSITLTSLRDVLQQHQA